MSSSFATEMAKIKSEIAAEEARQRKAAEAAEDKKRTLLERGLAHYSALLDGYRADAIARLERAAKALAAIGTAPTAPSIEGATDPDAFAKAFAAHEQAERSYEHAIEQVSTRLYGEIAVLHRLACKARNEARGLGLEAPQGVGFLLEHVKRHARWQLVTQDFTASLDRNSPWASLTVSLVERWVQMLREPAPELPTANSADYPAMPRPEQHDGNWVQRGWARISEALADDPPKPAHVPTQAERDADAYTKRQANVWPGGITPTGGGVTLPSGGGGK